MRPHKNKVNRWLKNKSQIRFSHYVSAFFKENNTADNSCRTDNDNSQHRTVYMVKQNLQSIRSKHRNHTHIRRQSLLGYKPPKRNKTSLLGNHLPRIIKQRHTLPTKHKQHQCNPPP